MSTSYVNGADWVTFAAFIMVAAGFARIISSITYFGNSHHVANLTGGLPVAVVVFGLARSPSGSEA